MTDNDVGVLGRAVTSGHIVLLRDACPGIGGVKLHQPIGQLLSVNGVLHGLLEEGNEGDEMGLGVELLGNPRLALFNESGVGVDTSPKTSSIAVRSVSVMVVDSNRGLKERLSKETSLMGRFIMHHTFMTMETSFLLSLALSVSISSNMV